MFELHKDAQGKFFMSLWSKGRKRELWKTSESYERRAGALKAFFLAAKAFGQRPGEMITYMDKTNPEMNVSTGILIPE